MVASFLSSIHNNKIILLFFFIFCSILSRIQTFFIPIYNGDESNLAIHALQILDGGLPYLDTIEKKPPLIYYIYAIVFAIIPDLRFMHFIVAIWIGISSYFLFLSQYRYNNQQYGFIVGMLYIIFSSCYLEMDMWASNVEIWANGFICLSIYYFFQFIGKYSIPNIFLTGFTIGLASLCRHQSGILLFVILILLLFYIKLDIANHVIKKINYIIILLIGFIIVWIITLIWTLYSNILYSFLEYVFYENFVYLQTLSILDALERCIIRTILYICSIIIIVILSIYALNYYFKIKLKNQNTNDKIIIIKYSLLYILIAFPAIIIGGRCYGHYYLQWLPGWVMLAAVGYTMLENARKKNIIIFGIFLTYLFFQLIGLYRTWNGDYESVNKNIQEICKTISRISNPGDIAFIWGNFTHPYYSANLKPASRFITCEYLISYQNKIIDYKLMRIRQNQLLSDLNNNKPEWIIDTSYSYLFPYWNGIYITIIPELEEIINDKYCLYYFDMNTSIYIYRINIVLN